MQQDIKKRLCFYIHRITFKGGNIRKTSRGSLTTNRLVCLLNFIKSSVKVVLLYQQAAPKFSRGTFLYYLCGKIIGKLAVDFLPCVQIGHFCGHLGHFFYIFLLNKYNKSYDE